MLTIVHAEPPLREVDCENAHHACTTSHIHIKLEIVMHATWFDLISLLEPIDDSHRIHHARSSNHQVAVPVAAPAAPTAPAAKAAAPAKAAPAKAAAAAKAAAPAKAAPKSKAKAQVPKSEAKAEVPNSEAKAQVLYLIKTYIQTTSYMDSNGSNY